MTFIYLMQSCLPEQKLIIQHQESSDRLDVAMIIGAAPSTEGDQQYSLGAVFQVSLAQGPWCLPADVEDCPLVSSSYAVLIRPA